jgi:hypothetical protein
LVDHLNIIPISHDVDRTFPVWYKSYTAKHPLYVCDRRIIHQEWKEYKDRHGHNRANLVECNNPCPMADEPNPWVDCPNGCKVSGILNFYIKELVDARIELPCELTVVGKTNFQEGGLFDQWNSISDRFPDTIDGFWSQAIPFPCGSYILCKLTRIEIDILRPQLDFNNKISREVNGKMITEPRRTGEKAKGKAYPLLLSVDPFWEATYLNWKRQQQSWKQIQEIRSAGFLPNKELLELAQVQVIDVPVVENSDRFLLFGQPVQNFLEGLEDIESPALLTEDQIHALRIALATSWKGIWRKDEALLLAALKRSFGVESVNLLRQDQFDAAKELLVNGEF